MIGNLPLAYGFGPAEFDRLRELGVHFTQEPLEMGPVATAVLDDTCRNLIQIVHSK